MPVKLLKNYPLILDGAMGTELLKRDVNLPLPLWSAVANETAPEYVYKIHLSYVEAGANIITTNTFRSTPHTFLKTGMSRGEAIKNAEINLKKAVELSKASSSKSQIIAGSIAPLEDCYSQDSSFSESEYNKSTTFVFKWLQEEGVDVIVFETMGNYQEILYTINFIKKYTIPVWISLILKDENQLLDGTPLDIVLNTLKISEIELLLLNCNTIQLSLKAIKILKLYWNKPWGVYPNLGLSNPKIDGTMNKIISREKWQNFIENILKENPSVFGACCGSTPKYTKILKNMIHGKIID